MLNLRPGRTIRLDLAEAANGQAVAISVAVMTAAKACDFEELCGDVATAPSGRAALGKAIEALRLCVVAIDGEPGDAATLADVLTPAQLFGLLGEIGKTLAPTEDDRKNSVWQSPISTAAAANNAQAASHAST